MGRPTRCFPQESPFLKYIPETTTVTTTTQYDDYLNYISIPNSGISCPIVPPEAIVVDGVTPTTTTVWPYLGYEVYKFSVSGDLCNSIIRYEPCHGFYENRLSEETSEIEQVFINLYDVENRVFTEPTTICACSGNLPQILNGNPTLELIGSCDDDIPTID